jgi:hypothetical protein
VPPPSAAPVPEQPEEPQPAQKDVNTNPDPFKPIE